MSENTVPPATANSLPALIKAHPLAAGAVAVLAVFGAYHFYTTVLSAGSTDSSSAQALVAPPMDPKVALHRSLDAAALDLAQGEYGPTGRSSLGSVTLGCDKVYDESLTEQIYGTIAAGETRLPAVKAHYTYSCVQAQDGARKRESRFWVVVARDDFANMYRCGKVAGREVVDDVAGQCDFRPESQPVVAAHVEPALVTPARTDNIAVPERAPPAPTALAPVAAASLPAESPQVPRPPAPPALDYGHESLKVVKQAAESGNAAAQAELGVRLQNGSAGAKDLPQAVDWFKQAAKQGNARAETNLGWLFLLGQGVSRDDQQALVLFREAAATGYPNAQDSLGWMYQHGRGVNKDLAAAREWYTKAASQGFKKSQENLATL
jgi:TPR repeat protein